MPPFLAGCAMALIFASVLLASGWLFFFGIGFMVLAFLLD